MKFFPDFFLLGRNLGQLFVIAQIIIYLFVFRNALEQYRKAWVILSVVFCFVISLILVFSDSGVLLKYFGLVGCIAAVGAAIVAFNRFQS